MNKKLLRRIFTRIVPGIIFIFIGVDSFLTHLDNNSYKMVIAALAIVGGVGFLFEGIFMKERK